MAKIPFPQICGGSLLRAGERSDDSFRQTCVRHDLDDCGLHPDANLEFAGPCGVDNVEETDSLILLRYIDDVVFFVT